MEKPGKTGRAQRGRGKMMEMSKWVREARPGKGVGYEAVEGEAKPHGGDPLCFCLRGGGGGCLATRGRAAQGKAW
eukprot:gene8848-biopygen9207